MRGRQVGRWILAAGLLIAASGGAVAFDAPPPSDPAPAAQQAVDLHPRFKTGDEAWYRYHETTLMQSDVDGNPTTKRAVKTVREMVIRRTVKEASATGATLELVFESIRVRKDDGPSVIEFDSATMADGAADHLQGPEIMAAIGKPIEVRVSSSGDVESVSGNADLPKNGLTPQFLGDDTFRKALRPIYAISKPDPRVAPGERWSDTQPHPARPAGTLMVNTEYTLRSVEDERAVFDLGGTVDFKIDPAGEQIQAAMPSAKVQGEQVYRTSDGALESMRLERAVTLTGQTDEIDWTSHTKTGKKLTVTLVTEIDTRIERLPGRPEGLSERTAETAPVPEESGASSD